MTITRKPTLEQAHPWISFRDRLPRPCSFVAAVHQQSCEPVIEYVGTHPAEMIEDGYTHWFSIPLITTQTVKS